MDIDKRRNGKKEKEQCIKLSKNINFAGFQIIVWDLLEITRGF